MIQEGGNRRKSKFGKFGFPGGRVDEGEPSMATAARELFEETKLSAEMLTLYETIYVEKLVTYYFLAGSVSGQIHFPPKEILSACWLTLSEIREMNVTGQIKDPNVILLATSLLEA